MDASRVGPPEADGSAWPRLRRFPADRALLVLLLAAAASLSHAGSAGAREYLVGACQADRFNFSTRAFGDFATRGMKIKRACDPEGPRLRGLITANVSRRGYVRRGSRAILTLKAPPGTRFVRFRWSGSARRRDCRYALQLWADGPGIRPIPIKNVRANRRCPRRGRAQAAGFSRPRSYDVPGANRIVQRVVCVGSRRARRCSSRGTNYFRTRKAIARIADVTGPSVAIARNMPLARGQWVRGRQALNYTAVDNVGIQRANALLGGAFVGRDSRACALAGSGAFAVQVPCPNGAGFMAIDTNGIPREGSQPLVVQGVDTAGNPGYSRPAVVRIDNTPPARVDVGVTGGEGWRNTNTFSLAWTNPPEIDRAPIVAATYRLCRLGASCTQATRTGANIAALGVTVPAPGQWTVSQWRRDAAGNEERDNSSVPVILRYDPEPPKLGFEPLATDDPTRVSAVVRDRVSGLAGGQIEISRQGSGIWLALPTQRQGSRLLTRIDDTRLPAGIYQLRARAFDQARNQGSTDRLLNGRPMVITLPLRIFSTLRAGVVRKKTVRRWVRRHGKRRRLRHRVTVLDPASRIRYGRRVRIAGRLTNRDGQGIGGQLYVYSRGTTIGERLVGVVHTDSAGRFSYTATASSSRTIRLVYGGTRLLLPAQREVRLFVPGSSTIRVKPRRVRNGRAVRFTGRLRGLPPPPGGKLVELQVVLSGHWQTFHTTLTDARGRWRVGYRFRRTCGVQRFRFRGRLPQEAGYPFQTGLTRRVKVRVRGRPCR